MKYLEIRPPASLAAYVRYFWVLEGNASAEKPYVHRSMADGCAELIFHYEGIFNDLNSNGNELSFRSGISGQSQQFRRFSIERSFGIFGVYLYPYALGELLKLHPGDSRNQMIDLRDLPGTEFDALEDRMMLAHDNRERLHVLITFLEQRLKHVQAIRPGIMETVQHLIHSKELVSVDELARHNFLSSRQFERHFNAFTGFSPKLFSRIIRFQHALSCYGSQKTLTEIGYEAGYYDQSHFIHDFKQFSGHNPRAYFAGNTESTVWKD